MNFPAKELQATTKVLVTRITVALESLGLTAALALLLLPMSLPPWLLLLLIFSRSCFTNRDFVTSSFSIFAFLEYRLSKHSRKKKILFVCVCGIREILTLKEWLLREIFVMCSYWMVIINTCKYQACNFIKIGNKIIILLLMWEEKYYSQKIANLYSSDIFILMLSVPFR